MASTIALIKTLQDLGYKKLITTPHIISDFYDNTPEIIKVALLEVKTELLRNNIDVTLEAAAEYFLDDGFIKKIGLNEQLLTFGDNYLLFETSFINYPKELKTIIFNLKSSGYRPIFAHPERYLYLVNNMELLAEIRATGVLFQINLVSLTGYYSQDSKKIAEYLVDNEMVDFVGSDCHHQKQAAALKSSFDTKYFRKLSKLPLLNHKL